MIAVIDYGVGNLFSLTSSLKAIGAECVVTSDVDAIRSADKIILPGVGAFEDAKRKLSESGLDIFIFRNILLFNNSTGEPGYGGKTTRRKRDHSRSR